MFVPENGDRTDNGAGPRTELSEPKNYFTFSGTHKMSYVTRVMQADHNVCVGQVKGDDYNFKTASNSSSELAMGGSPLIIVEIVYDVNSKDLNSHVRDANYNDVKQFLGKFEMNEPITLNIQVDGYNVNVNSNKQSTSHSYSFWKNHNYMMHFKAGAYLQGSGNSKTRGAKVQVSKFKTSHTTHL